MLRDGCNASLTISVQGENINLVTSVDLRRMNRIVGFSEAAAVLGGSISALRRSEAAHKTGGRTLGGEHAPAADPSSAVSGCGEDPRWRSSQDSRHARLEERGTERIGEFAAAWQLCIGFNDGSSKEWPVAQHDPIGLVAAQTGLLALNERSRDIFRQIVESYLATGEPVGSRNISRLIAIPLSPASVRNVMADLEQLGLIYAPHTSAGRLPTERGLRFFVDALMQMGDLTEAERASIQSQLASVGRAQSVEAALGEALTRLSGLTRAAAVVLTAKSNSRLKHIEFVRLEPERALVVLVGEDGQVENRVLALPPGVPPSALTEASNFLNARIRGRTLVEARLELETALAQDRAELDQLTQKIIAAGLASWSGGENHEDRQLIVRGHANLLDDLHALEDLERVRLLFDDLETKRGVIDLLGRAECAEGVRIFIGSENKLFSLSGSSTIVAPYRDAASHIVGVLGVIGPTRLNYARVIPTVDYAARMVSRMLGG
jgi:heat-inducible transcriptional repressor